MDGLEAKKTAVLVVEDDPSMRAAICRYLRARGYHAEGVATGRDALVRVQRAEFAAVVADAGQVRTYDLDLTREIQSLEGFRPWVMYTGVPDPLAPRGCGPSGVFCVLVNGGPLPELLRSVEEACRTRSWIERARCA